MRKHIRGISKRAKLGKSKPTLKPKSKLAVGATGSGKPTKKNGGVKNGKNGPRMTAGKRLNIAVKKWKDRKPELGDYTVGRGKQTPSSRAKYQKDLAAWEAKDPRNK